jgi:hypothetical protein
MNGGGDARGQEVEREIPVAHRVDRVVELVEAEDSGGLGGGEP